MGQSCDASRGLRDLCVFAVSSCFQPRIDDARERGRLESRVELWQATIAGATDRARPLLMTVASDVIGLLPIMWGAGTGSETMRRIAAPTIGGVVSASLVTLVVRPVLFVLVRGRGLPRSGREASRR